MRLLLRLVCRRNGHNYRPSGIVGVNPNPHTCTCCGHVELRPTTEPPERPAPHRSVVALLEKLNA